MVFTNPHIDIVKYFYFNSRCYRHIIIYHACCDLRNVGRSQQYLLDL
jgi:hypothetical protein